MSFKLTITKFHEILLDLVTFGLATQKFLEIFNGSPRKLMSIKVINSMELCHIWFGAGRVPWNSTEYFMEFHGFSFHSKFHETFMFHGIPWNLLPGYGNSMEFGDGAKFHGTRKIPWNSMELFFLSVQIPWNSTKFVVGVKFNGIPWNLPYDPEKFHGIPWNCKILILINFIICEVYFTVCCIISCYHTSGNP